MISTTFFLSNFGFTFDTADIARQEVEFHIQSRFAGIHQAGKDYIFQPRYPENKWQVNGTSDLGAKACASVCRGLSAQPNRIDVSAWISGIDGGFEVLYIMLEDWFKKNKHDTTITRSKGINNLDRATFGTRKSRFSLIIEDFGMYRVKVTWNMRLDKVMPTWEWLDFFHGGENYDECCKMAFSAITNSILGDDFFHLGLPTVPRLQVTKRPDIEEDWWGYLSGVASKIKAKARKEKSMFLAKESVQFLEEQIGKMMDKEAKELNELAIRDRQKSNQEV